MNPNEPMTIQYGKQSAQKILFSTSVAVISMVAVDPVLMMSSKTSLSSNENSKSFSLFRPPYWMGISSTGMYLSKVLLSQNIISSRMKKFYASVSVVLLDQGLCDLPGTGNHEFAPGSLS